jgi:Tol biopolymer transport system component
MDHTGLQVLQGSYLDFVLEIGSGEGRAYPVAVLASPGGEARGTLLFPYDEPALESRLKDLQIALLRSGGPYRRLPAREERAVQEFGRDLFEALFKGEVLSRYDVSLGEAARQGQGLRIKLRIRSPSLSALPWEYLYDARQAEYVGLSSHTPIVRYLELPQPPLPLTVTPPLRILGMVAAPPDLPPLDIGREQGRIAGAIQELGARCLVELSWCDGQSWRDLQQAMWGGPWHIFHFIGHGGYDSSADEGFVTLVGEQGGSEHLSATRLGRLLADHSYLRLAVLNACEGARGGERDIFSSTATILVRRGVPAVVAMQHAITDRAAIELAQTFYGALAHGKPVDEAIVEARKAISLAAPNTVEWGTPVLYMRAPDGALFDLPAESPAPHPHIAPAQSGAAAWQPGAVQRWFRNLSLAARLGLLACLLVLAVTLATRLPAWLSGSPAAETSPRSTESAPALQLIQPPATGESPVPATSTRMAGATPAGSLTPPAATTSPPAGNTPTLNLQAIPVGGLALTRQRILYPHAQWVRHVAFSADGSRLVCGASEISVWDVQTGTALVTINTGTTMRKPDVEFSPDGKWVAGMVNRVVMVWEVATGELLRELEGHTGYPVNLAFSSDGSRLVSGGEDKQAIVWDMATGQQAVILTVAEPIGGLDFSPHDEWLAAGSGQDVVLARAGTGGQFLVFKGHTARVNDVAFSPDGAQIASASEDGMVIVWKAMTGEIIYRLPAASGIVYAVSFSSDGRLLAAGTERGRVLVWELSSGNLLVKLDAHEEEIYDIGFSPDGLTLATASADTTIGLWDVR